MIIDKQHNGILINDIVNNQWEKKLYIGYTIKEAKKLFNQFIKTLKKQ